VKVLLARVVEFVFTKLYNVSHFARIPAVPLTAMIKNIVSNPLINSLSITLPQFIVVEIFWFYS
jgi:hypothetical protein